MLTGTTLPTQTIKNVKGDLMSLEMIIVLILVATIIGFGVMLELKSRRSHRQGERPGGHSVKPDDRSRGSAAPE